MLSLSKILLNALSLSLFLLKTNESNDIYKVRASLEFYSFKSIISKVITYLLLYMMMKLVDH